MWGQHHRTHGPLWSIGTADTVSLSRHSTLSWTQLFLTQSEDVESTLFNRIILRVHLALAWAGGAVPSSSSCFPGCGWGAAGLCEDTAFQLWSSCLWAWAAFPPQAGPCCLELRFSGPGLLSCPAPVTGKRLRVGESPVLLRHHFFPAL